MWSKLESIVKWFDWSRAHELKAGWIVEGLKIYTLLTASRQTEEIVEQERSTTKLDVRG